jgi:hypothetical protein
LDCWNKNDRFSKNKIKNTLMSDNNTQQSDYKTLCSLVDKLPRNDVWFSIKPENVEILKKIMSDFNMQDMEFSKDYKSVRRRPPIPEFKKDYDYKGLNKQKH